MSSIFLSQNEINELCFPRTQKAAKVKFLQSLGLKVIRKPNGEPIVSKTELERVLTHTSSSRESTEAKEPNKQAFLERLKNRRSK